MKKYYIYVWFAQNAPYYVGKGIRNRALKKKRSFGEMRDGTKIIYFRRNVSERHAKRIEALLVEKWGRKGIDPDGILENVMRPRDRWPHGDWQTNEIKKKMSDALMGRKIEWADKIKKTLKRRIANGEVENQFAKMWREIREGKREKPNNIKNPWNKGKSKKNDPRLAKMGDTISKTQHERYKEMSEEEIARRYGHQKGKIKGKYKGSQKGKNKGQVAWNKGLTKETDARLADAAAKQRITLANKKKNKTENS